ncbi:hypothetical protein MUK42_34241 [Musa troglodytarum]|uniref:Uncharacterized protein n=1 Tax=Musa troglodytarum TaxID=320322 RepID=A0A9E7FWL4_9LILI|nr:hypothetical protein MUK42_34241 [Musa troglodytarum]
MLCNCLPTVAEPWTGRSWKAVGREMLISVPSSGSSIRIGFDGGSRSMECNRETYKHCFGEYSQIAMCSSQVLLGVACTAL